MASFQKFKRNQVKFVIGHSSRKSVPRDGHVDLSLSYMNDCYIERGFDYLEKRLEELRCCKRSNVNVMAELIVTKPKTFNGSSKEFFDVVFDYVKLNYKEDNLIYFDVHRDEPLAEDHVHVGFVPTVYDRKKKKAVVSYDKCVHRCLDKFHPKLSEFCEKKFGYDIGIINGATRDGNKSIEQLKLETSFRADIADLQEKKQKLSEDINVNFDNLKSLYAELGEVKQYKKYKTLFERIPLLGILFGLLRKMSEECCRFVLEQCIDIAKSQLEADLKDRKQASLDMQVMFANKQKKVKEVQNAQNKGENVR